MKAKSILPLAVALTLLVGCSSRLDEAQGSPSSPAAATLAGEGQANAADQAFLDGMVPHHEMAVMMADEALQLANQADLKAFSVQVKADQGAEIAQMKAWKKAWFGTESTPPMDHGGMKALPRGAAYDAAWAREMIVHHQGAIDMAKVALAQAQRPEVKALAQRIVDAQLAEQVKLEAWAKAWGG